MQPSSLEDSKRIPPASVLAWILCALLASLWASDLTPGAALLELGLGLAMLRGNANSRVLQLAYGYQWCQVTAGVFYYTITGRISPAMRFTDFHRIVWVDLLALFLMALGVAVAFRLAPRESLSQTSKRDIGLKQRHLLAAYGVVVVIHGAAMRIAWQYPGWTQAILAFALVRYAVFYLAIDSVLRPTPLWGRFVALVGVEVALNTTGYFADFKQPLAMAALAIMQQRSTMGPARGAVGRRLAIAAIAATTIVAGLVWTGVKPGYRDAIRRGRLENSSDRLFYVIRTGNYWLSAGPRVWTPTLDALVDRVWQVRFPALALQSVPATVPHTNGALMWDAVTRLVMPRAFFPDKETMINDSDKVRAFTGVAVAGKESNTSFAFGYVAEAYVDFGYRLMYLPVFLYGLAIGAVFLWLGRAIKHWQLGMATVTVFTWLSFYSFESSWTIVLGQGATIAIFLGGSMILLDRFLTRSESDKPRTFRPVSEVP